MRTIPFLAIVGLVLVCRDAVCFNFARVHVPSRSEASPLASSRLADGRVKSTQGYAFAAAAVSASAAVMCYAAASRHTKLHSRNRTGEPRLQRCVSVVQKAVTSDSPLGSGEPVDNKIRAFFGRLYGLLCLPFGGRGNCAVVAQGCVGVVQRFGRFDRLLPPGRHRFNVASESVQVVPLKTVILDVHPQTVITKDNLTVRIDAVCFYRIESAEKALFAVEDYPVALSNLVQVTMRTVIGENTLEELFSSRPKINQRITELIGNAANPWGIEINQVELKEVEIPESMQRALAAVVEARQEAEAKLIQASAQRESASILAEASARMAGDPAALQLQWFETLRIIATQGRNATVIVPDRIDPKHALRTASFEAVQGASAD